jgi:hypothetical protein
MPGDWYGRLVIIETRTELIHKPEKREEGR